MQREVTIIVKDGADIGGVLDCVIEAGLEKCTSYKALRIIVGKIAVQDGKPDPTIYRTIQAMPEVDTINESLDYHVTES